MTYYFLKVYSYFLIYSLTIAFPQINFLLTNHFNHDQTDVIFEYNCLQIPAPKISAKIGSKRFSSPQQDSEEILSFCLTESVSKWHIPPNTTDQKFTFDDLRKQNVSSEQLYQWSASIDLIEDYAEYLTLNQSSLSNHVFYNCTPPRFGPQCQYEFLHLPSENLTLNEIILGFYRMEYKPKSLTCYKHLECDRGSKSLCLDWTEIADGYVDCLNNQVDEKFYWELQNNECEEDKYRCPNGQCIRKQFDYNLNVYDCLSLVDRNVFFSLLDEVYNAPTLLYLEDVACLQREKSSYTVLTSSCDRTREDLFQRFMLDDKSNTLSNICYFLFSCTFYSQKWSYPICQDICSNGKCVSMVGKTCPKLMIPMAAPIAFGHIYIGFLRRNDDDKDENNYQPEYVCYNETFCEGFLYNASLVQIDNRTCLRKEDAYVFKDVMSNAITTDSLFLPIRLAYHNLFHCNPVFRTNRIDIFNHSLAYRCRNSSKFIPTHQICDQQIDCPHRDDQSCQVINDNCSPILSNLLFKCSMNKKCISKSRFVDGRCDCSDGKSLPCEDEPFTLCNSDTLETCATHIKNNYIRKHISFPTICDGFQELLPISINGTTHTDESECQYWKCNNTYTRCDGYWNCFDGADEIECDDYPLINCSLHHHICIKPVTFELMCLPLEKANDGRIDCLGATDEPKQCRSISYTPNSQHFYCDSINNTRCVSTNSLCSQRSKCINENENLFCDILNVRAMLIYCFYAKNSNSSNLIKYLCSRPADDTKATLRYFSIGKSANQEPTEEKRSVIEQTFRYDFECHRGYPLRLRLNSNQTSTETVCFCSPSYYGEYCQYQNQRVSFTIKFQTFSNSVRTLFSLVILLTDNTTQRTIHSSKQITYISIKHCQIRFNFQLTYSTRPKHPNKTYYLINVQKDYNRSRVIRKQITSSDRCAHLSEYFNQTILDYHLIRRIKYYHLPCQQSISCFYDQDHFCLCNDFGLERVANCFEFDSTISQNCYKLSNCQNGGQCLQDDARCPQTSRCVCRECYYGSLCQFSSSLFDISLDGIIGVHIQPNRSIHLQPSIIKITLGLLIVMVLIGFINGMLSFMAFKNKETHQVGCGYYLLGSTIPIFLTSTLLTVKGTMLLLAQMSLTSNRTFLNIQCYLSEYWLKICPNMNRWLNGCVAMERAFNIIKGTNFDKGKSTTVAKYVIGLVILMTVNSTIYDPIHRHLVDNESNDEQKRIW